MYIRSIITAAFAGLAAAAPAKEAKKPYIAVSLFLHYDPPHSFSYQSPSPMVLYDFVKYGQQNKYVVKIDFEHDYHFGIPIGAVECQFYSDNLGQNPIGTATNKKALHFDKPTTVGSGICYGVPT